MFFFLLNRRQSSFELFILKSIKGSESELQDIKTAYMDCQGALNAIMANVPFLCSADRPRIAKIINGKIIM